MPFSSHETNPYMTIIGGGGGASTIAAGMVRHFPDVHTSVVISMSDDGGSTGKLRRQFETMSVGDIRRNIGSVAVTEALTYMLDYRFGSESDLDELKMISQQMDSVLRNDTVGYDEKRVKAALEAASDIGHAVEGGLRGHTYGNFLLTGLAVRNGFVSAVDEVSDVVGARAKIIPVTTTPHTLMMFDGKEIIRGEHAIDVRSVSDRDKAYIWLEPTAPETHVQANPAAIEVIEQSHLALISPGSPYTSIAPALAVDGISEALETQYRQGGMLAAVGNLENNPHDTADWCVGRYAQFFQRYIGKRAIDVMIYNVMTDSLPDPFKAVPYDPEFVARLNLTTIPANLVGAAAVKNKNDTMKRADVYHDTTALAEVIRFNNFQHGLGRFSARV